MGWLLIEQNGDGTSARRARAKLQKVDEAIERSRLDVELHPDSPSAFVRLGTAYENAGEISEAIKSYEIARQVAPDLASIRVALFRLKRRL